MMDDLKILKDFYINCENMTKEEFDFCLFYLNLCKEFSDTDNLNFKSNVRNTTILQCTFKKIENSTYSFNGLGTINDKTINKHENRCFNGTIEMDGNNAIIKSNIVRLCVDDDKKEYSTIDSIKLLNGQYIVSTNYSYQNNKKNKKI